LKLTETDVRYVANLANLSLSEQEVGRMVHDLGGILELMDQLAAIDTEGISPMSQVLYPAGETATLRPDVERAPVGNELAVANAAISGAGYFKVPRVIER
jgi:aspartyl-tRNA(Asn)/glutamyl-tRNA(Gln) amidotransferase subunit C